MSEATDGRRWNARHHQLCGARLVVWMAQAAGSDQKAAAARAFIAGRRVCHQGLMTVVVCAALLNAGLVAAVVSRIAGYAKAGLVVIVLIVVAVAVTTVVTSASVGRAVGLPAAAVDARQVEAAVTRCSARLGVDAPHLRIVSRRRLSSAAADSRRRGVQRLRGRIRQERDRGVHFRSRRAARVTRGGRRRSGRGRRRT